MVGCEEDLQENRSLVNRSLVNSYNDIAIQNAIVSQHTLFPYHFVTNGAELNELGQRDLAALNTHFVENAGHLNIRRHNTPAALYEARVNFVRDRLQEAGIDMKRMTISDDMPGGSGMPSESALQILEKEAEDTSTGDSTTLQSGIR
ncbi:MAG: hypothetical protein ACYSWW_28705 [Planctomycetota bacterium]|jgi:hypothetical protein